MSDLDRIVDALRAARFSYIDEDRLQQGIDAVLEKAEIEDVAREVRLGEAGRIDFMCGNVGIEVKVAGSMTALRRQLERYLATDTVTAVVVVTDRVRHGLLPLEINGKPVRVVSLVGQGL